MCVLRPTRWVLNHIVSIFEASVSTILHMIEDYFVYQGQPRPETLFRDQASEIGKVLFPTGRIGLNGTHPTQIFLRILYHLLWLRQPLSTPPYERENKSLIQP